MVKNSVLLPAQVPIRSLIDSSIPRFSTSRSCAAASPSGSRVSNSALCTNRPRAQGHQFSAVYQGTWHCFYLPRQARLNSRKMGIAMESLLLAHRQARLKRNQGSGEVVQQLKALGALAAGPGLGPGTHMATHDCNSNSRDLAPSPGLRGYCMHMVRIQTCR